MKNNDLAQKIKNLRNKKGFSQEELAEKTGLGLRTIQRIENGETEPRGDSLKRLALAFEVSPDEIFDWTVQEDKGFLISMNLSALSFLLFPLLGIIVPLIIWISKKDKIRNINKIAKGLLNFQITWTMLVFLGIFGFIFAWASNLDLSNGAINPDYTVSLVLFPPLFYLLMSLFNIVLLIINSVRLNKDKNLVYFPKIRFLKEVENG